MANPDDDKTIINVKGVPKPAWEAARRYAAQADEPMGMWLAGAISHRIALEEGRVKPPDNNAGKSGNPDDLTPEQVTARMLALAALQQSAAAMKQSKARRDPILKQAQNSLSEMLPPAPPSKLTIAGKANPDSGQSFPQIGKAWDGDAPSAC